MLKPKLCVQHCQIRRSPDKLQSLPPVVISLGSSLNSVAFYFRKSTIQASLCRFQEKQYQTTEEAAALFLRRMWFPLCDIGDFWPQH